MRSLSLYFTILFSILTAVALGQTPDARTPSALESSAIANEKTLIDAKKKDDAAFFKRALAPDFSLVGIDGQQLIGQEAADNLGDSGLTELSPYNIKVVSAGDGVTIVSYDAILRKAPEQDQGPPPRYQHFTSVWVKQADQWKLKFHQATAIHWGDW
jgi:hypothetical protein